MKSKLTIMGFIPRSGSNYLKDMILGVQGLGIPGEYYFPHDFDERLKSWGNRKNPVETIDTNLTDTVEQWFQEVVKRGAVNCTWPAYLVMLDEVGYLFEDYDISYVYLKRRDHIRQAISWYKASVTSRWTSDSPNNEKKLVYNREKIDERLNWILWQESQWEGYFRDNKIEHLGLLYENLNYGTIREIEKLSGLKRWKEIDIKKDIKYQIMRDDVTERWFTRYKEGK